MSKLRIAVIGAGVMGREHISALQSCNRAELVAIADPVGGSDVYDSGVPRFTDYQQMLKAVKPDGAIVATPPHTHVEIGIKCIELEVPSLIEKPVSSDLASAIRLEQAAADSDVPVLIGHSRRHNSINTAAKRAIEDGQLGDILAVTSMHLRHKPDQYFADKWKTQKGGGGVMLINVVHDFDCLRMLCGEIDEVHAITSNKGRGFEAEDTCVVMLKFASGALGTMTVSDATQAPWSWEFTSGEDPRFAKHDENSMLICGTKGSLSLPSMYLWKNSNGFKRDDPLSRTRLRWEPNTPLHAEQEHFLDVVERKSKPIVSVEDGNRTLAATLAVWESEKIGGWVSTDEMIQRAKLEKTETN